VAEYLRNLVKITTFLDICADLPLLYRIYSTETDPKSPIAPAPTCVLLDKIIPLESTLKAVPSHPNKERIIKL
jgi:hypothetical protein